MSPWPWWTASLVILIDFSLLIVSGLCFGFGFSAWPERPDPGAVAIIGKWSIVGRVFLYGCFFFYCRSIGVNRAKLGWTVDRAAGRAFLRCVAIGFPGFVLLCTAFVVIARLTGNPAAIQAPISADTGFGWLVVFAGVLPFVEEPMYRGIVHPTMRAHMGSWGAIVAGGFLFGALHHVYGIALHHCWGYAIAGMILAWIYERTGSLVFPWLIHVTANAATFALCRHPAFFEWLRGD